MRERKGVQAQGRAQQQARGRQRTQTVRQGLDDLEMPDSDEPLSGPLSCGEDLGPSDEIDGDLVLDDAEGPEGPLAFGGEDAEDWPMGRSGVALADLIGARRPVVLVRLRCEDGCVRARTSAARSQAEGAALEELRLFIEGRFRAGREDFTPEEWARLLGSEPASVCERLVLLSRLAVKGNTAFVISGEPADGERMQFTPHDRGLERYACKFATLPDGTPFSIRLLLLDGRGRPKGDHPFDRLPMALKLVALRRALQAERAEKKAEDDNAFRARLRDALEGLGIAVDKPTENHVTRFREALKRNQLGHLFPNARERQQQLDQTASADGMGPEGPA